MKKVVDSDAAGGKALHESGALESWCVPVSGFLRARRLRDALVVLVKEHGRSADVDGFAADHLGERPR